MNEELQKKLVELINGAQAAGTEAFLFTKEQVPDVIQQLLRWKFAEAVILVLISLAVVVFCIYAGRLAWKADGEKYMDDGHCFVFSVSAIVGSILSFIGMLNLMTAVQIWLAPKVYLLEYAASLIKK